MAETKKFKPVRGSTEKITDLAIVDGQFIIDTDTGKNYIDTEEARIAIKGVGYSTEGKSYGSTNDSKGDETCEIFNDSSNKAYNQYAHAEGRSTTASYYSHAEGYSTAALNYSHAEGSNTSATGSQSHAEGSNTSATGSQSHAEGSNTHVQGAQGHVEGSSTTINENSGSCHAEGYDNHITGSGVGSHAEGLSNTLAGGNGNHIEGGNNHDSSTSGFNHIEGSQNNASSGSSGFSHIEGYKNTLVSGQYVHIEGQGNINEANNTHIEGLSVHAQGYGSHAQGLSTVTRGDYSHAEGSHTKSVGFTSHAEGYNTEAGKPTFTESNSIITVTAYQDGYSAHAEGANTKAHSDYSHAEGFYTLVGDFDKDINSTLKHTIDESAEANAQYSHAEGWLAQANDVASHAEGFLTVAQGKVSHAEGSRNFITGNYSHAEGAENKISHSYSHVEGYLNSVHGDGKYSHIEGTNNSLSLEAPAEGSVHIEGANNILETEEFVGNPHIEGQGNTAIAGNYGLGVVHIEGQGNTIKDASFGMHVQGYDNSSFYGDSGFITGANNKSFCDNVFLAGNSNKVTGTGNFVFGTENNVNIANYDFDNGTIGDDASDESYYNFVGGAGNTIENDESNTFVYGSLLLANQPNNSNEVIFGYLNEPKEELMFSIGYGIPEVKEKGVVKTPEQRKNIFEIYNNGDVNYTGTLLGALPKATTEKIGAVQPDGSTIIIDENGVISAVGGGGSGSPALAQKVYIKYSAVEPTKNEDLTDTPNAWMGVATTTASAAPIDFDKYLWYNIKGKDGENGVNGINGITPIINVETKHWIIGDTDTGVIAEGKDGINGITPHIDSTTKHWVIGEEDTGVIAKGDGSASAQNFTVTLLASKWSSTAPYTQEVTVTGLTDSNPVLDVIISENVETGIKENTQWSYVTRASAQVNKLIVYCYETVPTVDLNVNIKVV